MTKRVSPTAIGAFVVASFAILVVALIVVGSGRMFQKPVRFICMFEGSLNGLKVGAPVKVRGVQIGSVAEIRLALAPSEGRLRPGVRALRLPVIIEVDRSQITSRGATGEALGKRGFQDMIKRGMRAQLNVESFLTGLLYINLDLHPETPINLAIVPGSGRYPEIPTIPTNLEAIQEQATKALAKLDQIDFKAMTVSITDAANSIKNLASSPDLKATLDSLKDTTAHLDRTVVSIRAMVDNANAEIDPLAASLRKNSEEANATMKQTRAALVDLRSMLDPDSPLAVHLNQALDQLTDTSRSIGQFTDYLQSNPAALVRGRYVSDKEK